jgi:hypothetical protein
MGQRTQIILRTVDNKGKKDTKVYHYQWGFAKTMFIELMALVLKSYRKDTWDKTYNFHDFHSLTNNNHEETEYIKEQFKKHKLKDCILKDINEVDIKNPKGAELIYNYCDNNNGVMVIEIVEGEKDYDQCKFTFGVLQGSEETSKPCTKFVTPRKYMKVSPSYCPEEFIRTFEMFCKYFKVESLKNKKLTVETCNSEKKEVSLT